LSDEQRRVLGVSPRAVLKGLGLIATLALVGWLGRVSGLAGHLDERWIDAQVRGHGPAGLALFVAVGTVFTALGLPRQVVAFLGGYAFGFVQGAALALLAQTLGCAATFVQARVLGRELVAAKVSGRIRRLDALLHGHPFSMTLVVRFLPVGSNLLTNLAAGVSSVRALPFLAGSALGYVPQTAIFALLGDGVTVDPVLHVALATALFLAAGALGVQLWRRVRRAQGLAEDPADALAD
jgi:uncharacterized membrane protein YdjX (TVP38/TMEM64 family)